MIERETGIKLNEDIREARILAKVTGAELSYGVILDSALCTAYTDTQPLTGLARSNKFYWAGNVLAKVTATGKYGLYQADATDGRELTADICVLKSDVNVQLGDRPAGVWKAFCCFDQDQLRYGAEALATIKTAMANCEFITTNEITS